MSNNKKIPDRITISRERLQNPDYQYDVLREWWGVDIYEGKAESEEDVEYIRKDVVERLLARGEMATEDWINQRKTID